MATQRGPRPNSWLKHQVCCDPEHDLAYLKLCLVKLIKVWRNACTAAGQKPFKWSQIDLFLLEHKPYQRTIWIYLPEPVSLYVFGSPDLHDGVTGLPCLHSRCSVTNTLAKQLFSPVLVYMGCIRAKCCVQVTCILAAHAVQDTTPAVTHNALSWIYCEVKKPPKIFPLGINIEAWNSVSFDLFHLPLLSSLHIIPHIHWGVETGRTLGLH